MKQIRTHKILCVTISNETGNSTSWTLCTNFQAKRKTLTFLAQIYPKINLGLENQKTSFGRRISILKIPCVPIFRQNRQLWLIRPKFAQKWVLGSEFQNLSADSKSAPPRNHMRQFLVKMDNFNFFRLNLRNLPNYVQYFGSNNVKGVAESQVEAEMSWMEEVIAWFSNTHFFNLKKKIIFCSQDI